MDIDDTENPFDTGAVNPVHPDVVQKTQLITELAEKHLLLKE